jgi:hypothetical protein
MELVGSEGGARGNRSVQTRRSHEPREDEYFMAHFRPDVSVK